MQQPVISSFSKEDAKLILFLSVDIAGSTAYKYPPKSESSPNPQHWFPFYRRFFEGFEAQFKRELAQLKKDPQFENRYKECSSEFTFWKCLGDELIFKAEIFVGPKASKLSKASKASLRCPLSRSFSIC